MKKEKTKKDHTPTWYRKKCVERAKKQAKERDRYICQWCGRKDGKMDGSHVFPEGKHNGMSAMVDNIKALCFQCHSRWHESPVEGVEWFKSKFPERYKKLKKISLKPIKTDWKKEYEISYKI